MWDADRAGVASEAALETLDQRIPVLEELDLPEELIPDHILNPQMDMPTQEVDEYEYIGRIDIPVLELSLPVMESWSYPKLKVAPCRYRGRVTSHSAGAVSRTQRTVTRYCPPRVQVNSVRSQSPEIISRTSVGLSCSSSETV